MSNKKVIVIGGGVTGMQSAVTLAKGGVHTTLVERDAELGGKLRGWHKLFPTHTPAHEVIESLQAELKDLAVDIRTNTEVVALNGTSVTLGGGEQVSADAVVIASGFELFDATRKEEYGYGIYDNVYTSPDLEHMFNEGKVSLKDGSEPRKIAILHCVGSRDEKVGQSHCSRVCCITGVKQAIELKQMFPRADIYNFYMDIRMFGAGYEEMYREAQQSYNINFIRGRISEASPTFDSKIQIKAEDTLIGRPLKMSVDMLVLLVGMCGGKSNSAWGAKITNSGFMEAQDAFTANTRTKKRGVFCAGTVTAPKNVGESLNEGVTAAVNTLEYLKRL